MKKFLFLLLFLSACVGTSKKMNFYTFTPVEIEANRFINKKILIRNVKVSEYLDRPQIILLKNNNAEYTISELSRWVEPLPNLIQKTIVADMAGFCNVDKYNFNMKKFDYIVDIYVDKIDMKMNENIKFKAVWVLLDKNKNVISTKKYKKSLDVGENYADVMQKMSLILSDFSQEIYKNIDVLTRKF